MKKLIFCLFVFIFSLFFQHSFLKGCLQIQVSQTLKTLDSAERIQSLHFTPNEVATLLSTSIESNESFAILKIQISSTNEKDLIINAAPAHQFSSMIINKLRLRAKSSTFSRSADVMVLFSNSLFFKIILTSGLLAFASLLFIRAILTIFS